MSSKPVIAIIAHRHLNVENIIPEGIRFLKLAGEVYSSEATFVLSDSRDFLERDGTLAVREGLEIINGEVVRRTYDLPKAVDFFYKRASDLEGVLDSATLEMLERNVPSLKEVSTRNMFTDEDVFRYIHRLAQKFGIPVSKTTNMSIATMYKARTERFCKQYEEEYGIPIARINHWFIQTPESLLRAIYSRNSSGKNTVIKPNSGTRGNGIAIVRAQPTSSLDQRLKEQDIQNILSDLSQGQKYVYCDYLSDPYLIDGRKSELRLNVVPFRRDDGSVDIRYCGCPVWLCPTPYSPQNIQDRDVSLCFSTQRDQKDTAACTLEGTSLYNPKFYVSLMQNARNVVRAFYQYSGDNPPNHIFLAFDYLVTQDEKPLFLELNSSGGCLDTPNQKIRAYNEDHLVTTMIPEMIHQARQHMSSARK